MKAEELLVIGKLFDKLGWSTQTDEMSQFPDLFETYCRMWNRLDERHRQLVFTLTQSYVWIRPSRNVELFLTAWKKFIPLLPKDVHEIVMAPLPRDIEHLQGKPPKLGIPKSSDFMHYLGHGYEDNLRRALQHRKLTLRSFEKVLEVGIRPGAALALVDDYVGSGNTINKALAPLRECGICAKSVYVVASVA